MKMEKFGVRENGRKCFLNRLEECRRVFSQFDLSGERFDPGVLEREEGAVKEAGQFYRIAVALSIRATNRFARGALASLDKAKDGVAGFAFMERVGH